MAGCCGGMGSAGGCYGERFDLQVQPNEAEPEAAEILLTATLGGRPYTFLLDTGAETPLFIMMGAVIGGRTLPPHREADATSRL